MDFSALQKLLVCCTDLHEFGNIFHVYLKEWLKAKQFKHQWLLKITYDCFEDVEFGFEYGLNVFGYDKTKIIYARAFDELLDKIETEFNLNLPQMKKSD